MLNFVPTKSSAPRCPKVLDLGLKFDSLTERPRKTFAGMNTTSLDFVHDSLVLLRILGTRQCASTKVYCPSPDAKAECSHEPIQYTQECCTYTLRPSNELTPP